MKFIVYFLFIFSNQLNGQIFLIDKEKNENVPFVELFDSKGIILGFSDENGIVTPQLTEKIKKFNPHFIYLKHMSYKTLTFSLKEFLDSNKFYLIADPITLPEVVIVPKNIKTFFIVEGYYRSYNIVDNQLNSYCDGRQELLYPIDSKNSILIKRPQNRSFLNVKLEESTLKNNITNINVAGAVTIDMNIQMVNLPNNRKIYNYVDESVEDYFLKSNDYLSKITQINTKKNDNAILQEIVYISPLDKFEYKGFGWHTKFEYHNETSLFNTNNKANISLANILYHKEVRKYKMKPKKDEPFQDVEVVREFFIDNIKYLDKKPKGFKRWGGFNKYSNYSFNFWEQLNNLPYYTPLPVGIVDAISKNLVELKNTSK